MVCEMTIRRLFDDALLRELSIGGDCKGPCASEYGLTSARLLQLSQKMTEPLCEADDRIVISINTPLSFPSRGTDQKSHAGSIVRAAVPLRVQTHDVFTRHKTAPDRESAEVEAAFQSRVIQDDSLSSQQDDRNEAEEK